MRFASSIGVTEEKITEYRAQFDAILLNLGKAQAQYTRSEEPTTQFIDLVGALLVSGRAHICDISTNQEPYDYPMALGWVEYTHANDGATWKPRGICIGWTDGQTFYLEPEVTYAEAQRLARDQGGSLPFTKQVLYGQLQDARLLKASDPNRSTKVKKINGKSKRLLWISLDTILGSDDDAKISEG